MGDSPPSRNMLPAPDADRDPAASSLRARLLTPREIGPYRIVRTIGEGGMGIVFLARQERPTRVVALKVIRASLLSPRTLSRFEQEAEVLARLQHPGIAQVYQVGTYATEQGILPYIAMEYVEGERLDHYATKHALTLEARLELAARLADAVEHAHQKGVIHRDLKPGNVLVTREGQPKVLDFGVARLSDDEDTRTTTLRTDAGALMGTLTYMSPEQAGGDPQAIDTRTDVYSLGVVLYELLSGRLPYMLERSALPEAVRVIQEEEPSKLSSHDRALRGDVETIVQKALEKDKQRRYPSAQAMADDIRRFLADEPILARAPSAWYQLTKFARRNRILVGGIGAVGLALLAGAAVATHLYLREREASARERQARVEAERAETHALATSDFLLSLFQGIDPDFARGADTTLLARILQDARARLSGELAEQPEVEARIRHTLGEAYAVLGLFDEGEAELRRALDLLTKLHGPDDLLTTRSARALSRLTARRGDQRAAERAQREMLARLEQEGSEAPDTVAARVDLADNLMRQGRYRESEELVRLALAQIEERHGHESLEGEGVRVLLAQVLSLQGKDAPARALMEKVFLDRSQRLGDDHPETISALTTLAQAMDEVEAEPVLRDAFERAKHVFGRDNQATLTIQNSLALSLERLGQTREAESMLRDCLARRRAVMGETHPETFTSLNNLGWFQWRGGRIDEALATALEAVELEREALGEDDHETLRARELAAFGLSAKKRFAEAAEHLGALARQAREVRSEDDPLVPQKLYNWAATLQNAGDEEAAEPILREALERVERHGLQSERFVPSAKNSLAKVLERHGQHEQADALFEEALGLRRKRDGNGSQEVAYTLSDWGEILVERGEFERAEPLLAELVRTVTALHLDESWRLASARMLHGRALAGLGRFTDAEALLVQAGEAMARLPDALPSAARETRAALLGLYETWDAAEPGQGIAARAERWQTKFPAE